MLASVIRLPFLGYAGFGFLLVILGLNAKQYHPFWRRLKHQPPVPMKRAYRITLVSIGVVVIAIELALGLGIVHD